MAFAKHGTLAYYTKDAQGLDKPEGLAIELADVLLRIANLCGALSLDLEEAVKEKHIYNLTRPWRHSKPGPEGPG
jgi:NTP pyrophosphatase (non-canonical NTP hydrolase)